MGEVISLQDYKVQRALEDPAFFLKYFIEPNAEIPAYQKEIMRQIAEYDSVKPR